MLLTFLCWSILWFWGEKSIHFYLSTCLPFIILSLRPTSPHHLEEIHVHLAFPFLLSSPAVHPSIFRRPTLPVSYFSPHSRPLSIPLRFRVCKLDIGEIYQRLEEAYPPEFLDSLRKGSFVGVSEPSTTPWWTKVRLRLWKLRTRFTLSLTKYAVMCLLQLNLHNVFFIFQVHSFYFRQQDPYLS
jgi:hypothetical protein